MDPRLHASPDRKRDIDCFTLDCIFELAFGNIEKPDKVDIRTGSLWEGRMQIRKAQPGDAVLLSRLNVHVQRMHAEAHPDLFKLPEDDAFAVPFFNALLGDPDILIYLAETELPLGYVVLRIMRREENPFMHAWQYVYIDQICVQPEFQGTGVGKALMVRSEQTAQELDLGFVGLDSWDFNTKAHEFFYSQGYQVYNLRMWKRMPG